MGLSIGGGSKKSKEEDGNGTPSSLALWLTFEVRG